MKTTMASFRCVVTFFAIGMAGCATPHLDRHTASASAVRQDLILYFATNRLYQGGSDTETFFGNIAGNPPSKLRVGQFPVSTNADGSDFKPGNLRITDETDWMSQIRLKALVDGKPRRTILIFVHGFNTSFEGAAESLARLESGFRDDVVPIFYTWPSRAKVYWYTADENEAAKSGKYFADFLVKLHTEIPEADIAIVAHSMGNRVAIAGIDIASRTLLTDPSKKPFKFAALIAADIDREYYASTYSDNVNRSVEKVIIYASAKDKALAASKKVHNATDSRLGQNDPQPYRDSKSETVDASEAGTDFLGHGYFASNRLVISDLVLAVTQNLPAWRRPGLRPLPNLFSQDKYWWLMTN